MFKISHEVAELVIGGSWSYYWIRVLMVHNCMLFLAVCPVGAGRWFHQLFIDRKGPGWREPSTKLSVMYKAGCCPLWMDLTADTVHLAFTPILSATWCWEFSCLLLMWHVSLSSSHCGLVGCILLNDCLKHFALLNKKKALVLC